MQAVQCLYSKMSVYSCVSGPEKTRHVKTPSYTVTSETLKCNKFMCIIVTILWLACNIQYSIKNNTKILYSTQYTYSCNGIYLLLCLCIYTIGDGYRYHYMNRCIYHWFSQAQSHSYINIILRRWQANLEGELFVYRVAIMIYHLSYDQHLKNL